MQQASTVQVVTRVTGTPTFQETQQVQVLAAQPEETSASDDEVAAVTAAKTATTATVVPGMSPEVQAQLEKDKRAVYS